MPDAILTDQQLISEMWIGKKTGNIFRAVSIVRQEGVRIIKYAKSTGETFEVPYPKFMSRFRPAKKDELWQAIMESRADGADGENAETTYLTEPDHRHEFANMVLHQSTIQQISVGLNRIVRADDIEREWQISKIEPKAKKCILGFSVDLGLERRWQRYVSLRGWVGRCPKSTMPRSFRNIQATQQRLLEVSLQLQRPQTRSSLWTRPIHCCLSESIFHRTTRRAPRQSIKIVTPC